MNEQKLLEVQDQHLYSESDNAFEIIYKLIDRAIDDDGLDDLNEAIWEELEEEFIYYADAWDYMEQYGDNDFTDAFNEGYTDICGIATYNLENEISEVLRELGLNYEDFEKGGE